MPIVDQALMHNSVWLTLLFRLMITSKTKSVLGMAADYSVTYVVNSDAHHPKDVSANLEEAARIGERIGLTMVDLSYLELTSEA